MGQLAIDVAVTGGLGTILDPIVKGLQGVLNLIDTTDDQANSWGVYG